MRSGVTRSKLTLAPKPPAGGAAARTYQLLLATTLAAIDDGHVPSIAEVAVRAKVSRATAYRYFPSRSVLITAVVEASLAPVRSWKSVQAEGAARVREMFTASLPSLAASEPQLRAAIQLSLEQWALERAGLLEEEPYRRGHRMRILAHAVAPFAGRLPARSVDRLQKALSVIFGIEPHIVLKDIWGASAREVDQTVLWMVDALIAAALREAKPAPAKRRTP